MLMDILMEALMSMDDESLNYVLESCDAEELEIIDAAMEMKIADRSNPAVQNYVKFMKGARDQNKNPRELIDADSAELHAPSSNTRIGYFNNKYFNGRTSSTFTKATSDGHPRDMILDPDMNTVKSAAKDLTRKEISSQKINGVKNAVKRVLNKR